MSNYPNGVTGRDIDSLCQTDNSNPNREECFLCKRMLQQSLDFDRWFVEDGSGWVPTHYSDFTDAFRTEQGMCCGHECWNDKVALNEDESVPAPKLFLVGGAQ